MEKKNIILKIHYIGLILIMNGYRKHFNSIYKIGSNLPICNISWYEAEAYCNWKNVRFINEYEWEYISTNLGRNTYPWGDNEPTNDLCNINNKYKYCVECKSI